MTNANMALLSTPSTATTVFIGVGNFQSVTSLSFCIAKSTAIDTRPAVLSMRATISRIQLIQPSSGGGADLGSRGSRVSWRVSIGGLRMTSGG